MFVSLIFLGGNEKFLSWDTLILSKRAKFSEAVCLPNVSSHLREVVVRLFSDCYNYTTQHLGWSQSMTSKKEKNPTCWHHPLKVQITPKALIIPEVPTFILLPICFIFSDIHNKRMIFSSNYNNQRCCSTVMYSYTIRPHEFIQQCSRWYLLF